MDLLQGTLDLLILRALILQPDHGLGIPRRIQQITKRTFDWKPGSLFPALHRLEEKGWLASQWGESANRRRAKYYRLTTVGHRQIDTELANWQRIALAPLAPGDYVIELSGGSGEENERSSRFT